VLHAGTDRLAKFYQPLLFGGLQEDPFSRDALAEHFVLGFEEFEVADELVLRTAGQVEEQRLENANHRDILRKLMLALEMTIFLHSAGAPKDAILIGRHAEFQRGFRRRGRWAVN